MTCASTDPGSVGDAAEVEADNARAWELRYVDPRRSRELADRCRVAAEGDPRIDRYQYLAACRTVAALDHDVGDLDASFSLSCSLLLELDDKIHRPIKSSVLSRLASVNYFIGDLEEALRLSLEAIAMASDCGARDCLANALSTLGLVYGLMREPDDADAAFVQSIEVARADNDDIGVARALNNRAWVAGELGRHEAGLRSAREALVLLEKSPLGSIEGAIYETTGMLYRQVGDAENARWHFEQALDRATATSNRLVTAEALIGLGRLASDQHDDDRATELLEAALDAAKTVGSYVETAAAHRELSEVHARVGRAEEALSHFRQFHDLGQRLLTDKANLAARVLKVRYETDRAQAEQQLERRRNTLLEAEIDRRHRIEDQLLQASKRAEEATREALVARDEADRSSQAKSEFLANMGHDLRTPLNGILGYAQILQRRGSLDDRDRRAVDVILRSGNHLLRMVDDLLDLSRIESNDLELKPEATDTVAFVDNLVEVVAARAEERGIELRTTYHVDLPAMAIIDPSRSAQVLLNILDNALKFAGEAGQVEITVGPSVADPAGLTVAIADNGPGIDPDEIDRIFDRFQRGGGDRSTDGGSGLGLTIAKHLTELMGGSLHVSSVPGEGSMFMLGLPSLAEGEVQIVGGDLPASTPDLGGLRALVVDDDAGSREVLAGLLIEWGAQTREVESGAKAIEVLTAFKPDIVFVDMWMPGMSGPQAAAEIRRLGPLGQVPVVAVTASPFDPSSVEHAEARIDVHVLKPIVADTLAAALSDLLADDSAEPGFGAG